MKAKENRQGSFKKLQSVKIRVVSLRVGALGTVYKEKIDKELR